MSPASAVFAGLVCGYALALITTPLIAVTLLSLRARYPAIERTVPRQAPFLAIAVIVHGGALTAFTAIGIVLGLILAGIDERAPEGWLGSPNGVFTVIVVLWTVAAFAPIMVLLRPLRRQTAAAAILFAALFGWFMPYLAQWSPVNG